MSAANEPPPQEQDNSHSKRDPPTHAHSVAFDQYLLTVESGVLEGAEVATAESRLSSCTDCINEYIIQKIKKKRQCANEPVLLDRFTRAIYTQDRTRIKRQLQQTEENVLRTTLYELALSGSLPLDQNVCEAVTKVLSSIGMCQEMEFLPSVFPVGLFKMVVSPNPAVRKWGLVKSRRCLLGKKQVARLIDEDVFGSLSQMLDGSNEVDQKDALRILLRLLKKATVAGRTAICTLVWTCERWRHLYLTSESIIETVMCYRAMEIFLPSPVSVEDQTLHQALFELSRCPVWDCGHLAQYCDLDWETPLPAIIRPVPEQPSLQALLQSTCKNILLQLVRDFHRTSETSWGSHAVAKSLFEVMRHAKKTCMVVFEETAASLSGLLEECTRLLLLYLTNFGGHPSAPLSDIMVQACTAALDTTIEILCWEVDGLVARKQLEPRPIYYNGLWQVAVVAGGAHVKLQAAVLGEACRVAAYGPSCLPPDKAKFRDLLFSSIDQKAGFSKEEMDSFAEGLVKFPEDVVVVMHFLMHGLLSSSYVEKVAKIITKLVPWLNTESEVKVFEKLDWSHKKTPQESVFGRSSSWAPQLLCALATGCENSSEDHKSRLLSFAGCIQRKLKGLSLWPEEALVEHPWPNVMTDLRLEPSKTSTSKYLSATTQVVSMYQTKTAVGVLNTTRTPHPKNAGPEEIGAWYKAQEVALARMVDWAESLRRVDERTLWNGAGLEGLLESKPIFASAEEYVETLNRYVLVEAVYQLSQNLEKKIKESKFAFQGEIIDYSNGKLLLQLVTRGAGLEQPTKHTVVIVRNDKGHELYGIVVGNRAETVGQVTVAVGSFQKDFWSDGGHRAARVDICMADNMSTTMRDASMIAAIAPPAPMSPLVAAIIGLGVGNPKEKTALSMLFQNVMRASADKKFVLPPAWLKPLKKLELPEQTLPKKPPEHNITTNEKSNPAKRNGDTEDGEKTGPLAQEEMFASASERYVGETWEEYCERQTGLVTTYISERRRRIRCELERLNDEQQAFVEGVFTSTRVLLQGGGGVGKTRTFFAIAEIVGELELAAKCLNLYGITVKYKNVMPSFKMLIVTQSNKPIDDVLRKLKDKGITVVRVGSLTNMEQDLRHLHIDKQLEQEKERRKKELLSTIEKKEKAGEAARNSGGGDKVAISAFMEQRLLDRLKAGQMDDTIKQELLTQHYRVTVGTCSGMAAPNLKVAPFDIICVDEGGIATHVAVLGPVGHARAEQTHLVIAGDPLQLSPFVKSPMCRDAGFDVSVMELIMESAGITFGTPSENGSVWRYFLFPQQYRMDPRICCVASTLLYEGRLVAAKNVPNDHWGRFYNEGTPFEAFMAINVFGYEEKVGTSYRNPVEAKAILEMIGMLISCGEREYGTREQAMTYFKSKIAIICAYEGQCEYVRRLIKDRPEMMGLEIVVDTTDSFQGSEKAITFGSPVRTDHLGFLRHAGRNNVALTRARHLLIFVANKACMDGDKILSGVFARAEEVGECLSIEERDLGNLAEIFDRHARNRKRAATDLTLQSMGASADGAKTAAGKIEKTKPRKPSAAKNAATPASTTTKAEKKNPRTPASSPTLSIKSRRPRQQASHPKEKRAPKPQPPPLPALTEDVATFSSNQMEARNTQASKAPAKVQLAGAAASAPPTTLSTPRGGPQPTQHPAKADAAPPAPAPVEHVIVISSDEEDASSPNIVEGSGEPVAAAGVEAPKPSVTPPTSGELTTAADMLGVPEGSPDHPAGTPESGTIVPPNLPVVGDHLVFTEDMVGFLLDPLGEEELGELVTVDEFSRTQEQAGKNAAQPPVNPAPAQTAAPRHDEGPVEDEVLDEG